MQIQIRREIQFRFNYGLVMNSTGNTGIGSASFDGTNPENY